MRFRRRIPSLTALVMLEAVVRHKSFTAAAGELGVTQAAVSRQIALLEDELGQLMFVRKHRAIEPTSACLLLASTLSQSLSSIADSIEAITSLKQDVVTIGATVAFSSFWLLPRLSDFRRENPGVQIRVVSQDSKFDLGAGTIDIAIRYGTPPFADGMVIASRGDVIVPVCSPEYLKRRTTMALSIADEFIDQEAAESSWHSWSRWAQKAAPDFEIRPSLRFNHYTEAISAARAGQGIALGWQVLVQTFLDDGTLVALDVPELTVDDRYNILLPLRTRRTPAADQAAQWLKNALHA